METFTILTTMPNAVAAPVHDRMPVILEGAAIRSWLDERATPEALAGLLHPCPDDALTRYPAAPLVGNPRNDGPECIQPLPGTG